MKHEQVEERGIVEAYVRHELAPDDCVAFEEHYFQCAQCFEDVELTGKLVRGVGYAVGAGLLDESGPARTLLGRGYSRRWLYPAFTLAAAVCLALIVRDADLQRQLRDAAASAHAAQNRIAELDGRAAANTGPEANIPVAILTAARSARAMNELILRAQSRQALLWIDIPPQPPAARFEIRIASSDGGAGKIIHDLERNSDGALAATLPVNDLAPGIRTVSLYDEKEPGKAIAEYRLSVVRR